MRTPKVVIEHRNVEAAEAAAQRLREQGIETTVCTGPEDLSTRCPLLVGGSCELVAEADAVLYDLDLDDPRERMVLEEMRVRYPRKAVVVEASERDARKYAAELDGLRVVLPFSPDRLSQVIQEELEVRVAH